MRVTFGSTKFVRHWLPAHLPLRPHLLRRHHQRLHHASQLGSCPGGPRASWGLSVFSSEFGIHSNHRSPRAATSPRFCPKRGGRKSRQLCTPSLPQSGGRKSRQLSYARIRRSTSSRFQRLFEQERGLPRRVPPVGIRVLLPKPSQGSIAAGAPPAGTSVRTTPTSSTSPTHRSAWEPLAPFCQLRFR